MRKIKLYYFTMIRNLQKIIPHRKKPGKKILIVLPFKKTATLFVIIFVLFSAVILLLTVRGLHGNPGPLLLNTKTWKENGPFELSPERGRYTLLYSYIEDHSFYFSVPLARFTVPDLGYKSGHYVSLFAPGVSFLAIPGYLIGRSFDIAQVGTYAVVGVFALLNALLIRMICVRLGANPYAALLAAGAFLFATPAFSYSATLYEHHFSTFLILLSLYALIRWNNFWSLALIWFCCALSIPVDNPNVFFMAPIGLFALGRLVSFQTMVKTIAVKINLFRFLTFFVMIIPLLFFFWVNKNSYGSPFQLAGTVGGVEDISPNGKPALPRVYTAANIDKILHPDNQQKSVVRFFKSRNLLNGMYILMLSPDRGTLWFTPVMFLGLLGIGILHRKNEKYTVLFATICGAIILLYAMWGDPWGGWAFGPRYLIPAFSVIAIYLSLALTKFRRNALFLIIFLLLFGYSTYVNTIGVLTSNANPPQQEVLALEKITGHQEKYTYERDLDLLKHNTSKSYVWQTYLAHSIPAMEYFTIILSAILLLHLMLMAGLIMSKEDLPDEI